MTDNKSEIPEFLLEIASKVEALNGTMYIVGGWVRDFLLGAVSLDFDLEVYGLEVQQLNDILESFGQASQVGKSFGIVTLHRAGRHFDFAFPRTENKTGKGHRGFMVKPDPGLTFEKASSRRDFTINAMGMRLPGLEIVDCHGGQADLANKLLRHVSDAFSEDPLRAMRAVQFAARFELDIHPETQVLCRKLPLEELSRERIFGEFNKLFLKASKPSIGLEWMRRLDLLRYFPELAAMIDVKQDPEWHPEGDVWTHNNMVLDEAASLKHELSTDKDQLAFMYGALCHDFGKAETTVFEAGRWIRYGHEAVGVSVCRNFMARLTNDAELIEEVEKYVRTHMRPVLLYKERDRVGQGAIRRLALEIHIPDVIRIAKADHFGRTSADAMSREFPAGDWLQNRARELQVFDEKPASYLRGKDLLELGMEPGPGMGDFLNKCFELQLDGKIRSRDEALAWAKKSINSSNE
jgi:tRNA nucleotidyltransferase (CCA-adding enzyme)